MSIVHILIQFVFRLTFGVALAMVITPSRWVSSGFFRVHLWVLMGLNTLASLLIYTQRESLNSIAENNAILLSLAIGLSLASYAGAVIWLYEKSRAGKFALILVMVFGLIAAELAATPVAKSYVAPSQALTLREFDVVSSGMLLGAMLTAMFLGHWYLNTPTMELSPLKRLMMLIAAAILVRALLSGAGLYFHVRSVETLNTEFWIFVALRWLAGLVGTFVLTLLTWLTLKIPNTQSATGILYASVILAFIGELTSQFLSANTTYPL